MKQKRNLILGLAILGAIIIVGAGFTACHKPPMFCGGFHSKDFPKHVLERIDEEVAELNLNEAQQVQYEEIRKRVETALIEIKNNRKAFFEKVKGEMGKEAPDLKVISELLKSRVERFPLRAGMFIDDFMEFYEMLDEDQQAMIISELKDKFKKFEAFRTLISS